MTCASNKLLLGWQAAKGEMHVKPQHRNLEGERSHSVPDWCVKGALSSVHCWHDIGQYKKHIHHSMHMFWVLKRTISLRWFF